MGCEPEYPPLYSCGINPCSSFLQKFFDIPADQAEP